MPVSGMGIPRSPTAIYQISCRYNYAIAPSYTDARRTACRVEPYREGAAEGESLKSAVPGLPRAPCGEGNDVFQPSWQRASPDARERLTSSPKPSATGEVAQSAITDGKRQAGSIKLASSLLGRLTRMLTGQ